MKGVGFVKGLPPKEKVLMHVLTDSRVQAKVPYFCEPHVSRSIVLVSLDPRAAYAKPPTYEALLNLPSTRSQSHRYRTKDGHGT